MTTLTPEQKQAIAGWIAAGDNLSTVQKKLSDQFKLSLTYMDVRFLVDDLGLELKNAAPKADAADIAKAPAADASPQKSAEKKGFFDKAKEKLGLARDDTDELQADVPGDDLAGDTGALDELPAGSGTVKVSVDSVTLIPGAVASGTVVFSDGVTGKWIVDNYGRPGFTEISRVGYRPSPADAQAFMQELGRALQKKGF